MSQQLINLSPDLKKLRDEGYDIEIVSSYLVLKGVPYVNSSREVKYGTLISALDLAGNRTIAPNTHVVHFMGEYPCHNDGREIDQIRHGSAENPLDKDRGLISQHSFSNKPQSGYKNYHEKMTNYVAIISHPAQSINPDVTAQTFRVIMQDDEDTPFHYLDTASSRADIVSVTQKLKLPKVAIVGLGGTGSYVLDLVSKTPVKEIHLFDPDIFLQHNAFRSPGASSVDELSRVLLKVEYFKERYSKMHKGIISHGYKIDDSNVGELREMDFVFLCLDSGGTKRFIIEKLKEFNMPFIDTGMGIHLVGNSLLGILRVTTGTVKKSEHTDKRITFSDDTEDGEYSQNIQIADLNALSASLAVVKWKKLFGFYKDLEEEHHSTYTIDGNIINNEDAL